MEKDLDFVVSVVRKMLATGASGCVYFACESPVFMNIDLRDPRNATSSVFARSGI
jgi:hypothetical protein